jgi:hypothetical protein
VITRIIIIIIIMIYLNKNTNYYYAYHIMRRNHDNAAVDTLDPRRKRLSQNVTKNKITNLKLSTFRALRLVTIYSTFQQRCIPLYLTTTHNLITDISLCPLLRYALGKVHLTTDHGGPEEE